MTPHQSVDLTPAAASGLIRTLLREAHSALDSDDLESSLDRLVAAMGLSLQLGPDASQLVLSEVVAIARELAHEGDASALSALGPALVGLIQQTREAHVLPPTRVMDAWAELALDLGVLVGQVGLALTLGGSHRTEMMGNARMRAALLDDATGEMFALAGWLDRIEDDCRVE